MPCVHLRQLIQLCEQHQLKMGGSDVIQLVCEQCGQQEVCPDILMDEYDHRQGSDDATSETAQQTDS